MLRRLALFFVLSLSPNGRSVAHNTAAPSQCLHMSPVGTEVAEAAIAYALGNITTPPPPPPPNARLGQLLRRAQVNQPLSALHSHTCISLPCQPNASFTVTVRADHDTRISHTIRHYSSTLHAS